MMSLLMDGLETLVPISMNMEAKRKSKGEKWGQLGSPLNLFCSFPDAIRVWRPGSRPGQRCLESSRTLRKTGHGLSHNIKSLDEWGKQSQGMIVHRKAECGLNYKKVQSIKHHPLLSLKRLGRNPVKRVFHFNSVGTASPGRDVRKLDRHTHLKNNNNI